MSCGDGKRRQERITLEINRISGSMLSPAKFSRSIEEPGRASRRLHAGCRSGSLRASPELIPEDGSPPVLASPNSLSTLLRRFACARLSRPCLPESSSRHFRNAHTTAFDRSSLRWLGIGDLITEPEGPTFISRTVVHRRVDGRCSCHTTRTGHARSGAFPALVDEPKPDPYPLL